MRDVVYIQYENDLEYEKALGFKEGSELKKNKTFSIG